MKIVVSYFSCCSLCLTYYVAIIRRMAGSSTLNKRTASQEILRFLKLRLAKSIITHVVWHTSDFMNNSNSLPLSICFRRPCDETCMHARPQHSQARGPYLAKPRLSLTGRRRGFARLTATVFCRVLHKLALWQIPQANCNCVTWPGSRVVPNFEFTIWTVRKNRAICTLALLANQNASYGLFL